LRDFGEKIAWLKKLSRENVNPRMKKERKEKSGNRRSWRGVRLKVYKERKKDCPLNFQMKIIIP
jgi:hypothetical protein